MRKAIGIAALVCLVLPRVAQSSPVTNPNDPRTWQGASVGTFAQLYYGSNTLANRQLVVNNGLLDDGVFNAAGFLTASLVQGSFQGCGTSLDLTGTGSLAYIQPACAGSPAGSVQANGIDEHWVQTQGNPAGNNFDAFFANSATAVWDLGFSAVSAAIFNTIDHDPLPQEAIESTIYLTNAPQAQWGNAAVWTRAETQRVWLEGFMPNTGILWDGFTYAVGTPTDTPFRYAAIIWGGPGGLYPLPGDGDNEINGVMGLAVNFTPLSTEVPEPGTMLLLGTGLAGLVAVARRRRQA